MRMIMDSRLEGLRDAVDEIVKARMAQGLFPSAVVRIFDRHETLLEASFGQVQPDTVFDVASLTKIATATQILCLISNGQLKLDEGILSVLPALSEQTLLRKRLAGVSIYSLLTHSSGIVDWYPFYAHRGLPFEQVLQIALERCGPVEGMVYSDLNFMLLGKVVEALSGKPLDVCLEENLVKPLGLGRMSYHSSQFTDIAPSSYGNRIEEDMCVQRGIAFEGWRDHSPIRGECNDGNAYYYFGGVAGSAGIFADALSYESLARFYMNTQDPLLIQAQMTQLSNRGLGFQTGEMYPEGCGHTGFTGTSLYFSRKLDIGLVIFTNRLYLDHPLPEGMQAFRRQLHEAVVSFLRT